MGQKWGQKHTTPGIRWSSPTQLLVWPSDIFLVCEKGPDIQGAKGGWNGMPWSRGTMHCLPAADITSPFSERCCFTV
ncbi:hypothetical protein B0T14DRAFT_501944 [Immersiella caudata]|uniref:Uncharacterized protein n=1 Tax=Immersiella caudata TaxID=314043 RepID=A0AA39XCU5_9PEZI|nr:hypothetical protein B0T14DRAFT_501944 [Immersiella caudata]